MSDIQEYIRYDGVIGKITKVFTPAEKLLRAEYFKAYGLMNTTLFGSNADILLMDDTYKKAKKSTILIDLVEEGDYVNGKEVYSIGTAIGNLPVINYTDGTFTLSNMIKSIVTKERFKESEYKVNE